MPAKSRVLIIEDNPDLLSVLETVLCDDYEVETARRGEDGVTRAMSFRPDIVILDLQLPNMDGIEAGRWIKRTLDDVPIIVLTALAGPGDEEAILSSGCCDAYLPKPTPLDEIRRLVGELLGEGESVGEGVGEGGTS